MDRHSCTRTKKIFLNTKGKNATEVPEELIHFLNYMEQSTDEYVASVCEESIIRLHEKVTELKKWRELEARYMTFEELVLGRERHAKAEGKAEGKAEAVIELLEDYGVVFDILREKIM